MVWCGVVVSLRISVLPFLPDFRAGRMIEEWHAASPTPDSLVRLGTGSLPIVPVTANNAISFGGLEVPTSIVALLALAITGVVQRGSEN